MRLTRRDAIVALGAAGVAAGTGALAWSELADDGPLGEHERATLVAVARVVYPDEVEGIPEFVERYTVGRVRDRPEYAEGVADAVATLDDYATDWEDTRAVDLPDDKLDQLLREMGADIADPDPDGIDPQRVRHYLVNELLYALYTTPTGGELVGIENPQGYPGGTTSYRQPPPSRR